MATRSRAFSQEVFDVEVTLEPPRLRRTGGHRQPSGDAYANSRSRLEVIPGLPRPELDGRCASASVRGRLVDDDGEADDLVVADAEVAGHNQLVGQVGLVVGAVPLGPDDDVAIVVDDLADIHRHVVADELLGEELPDGIGAPNLPLVVVDVRVIGERVHDAIGVEGVHRVDVLVDDRGQLGDDLADERLARHGSFSFVAQLGWAFMSGSIASDGLTTRPTIRVIRQSPAPPLSGPAAWLTRRCSRVAGGDRDDRSPRWTHPRLSCVSSARSEADRRTPAVPARDLARAHRAASISRRPRRSLSQIVVVSLRLRGRLLDGQACNGYS